MKPISPQLLALLNTTVDLKLFVVDTYSFALAGGGVLRYCTGDADITVNGILYPSGGVEQGPYFDRSDNKAVVHWKLGVDVDTLVFDVIPGNATVLGEPFLTACIQGQFDGAELTLQRLFMPTYGDTRRGPLTMFVGRVAEIQISRSIATFTVNSHLELLNLQFPRNLYQAPCVNNLGDSACGVSLSSFSTSGTALTGSTSNLISANLTGTPVGAFDQGKINFTSGALNGLSRSVKTGTFGSPGSISLLSPFPVAPANGDAFTIFQGCSKSFTDVNGCPKFLNTARFRGFDRIPEATTAV